MVEAPKTRARADDRAFQVTRSSCLWSGFRYSTLLNSPTSGGLRKSRSNQSPHMWLLVQSSGRIIRRLPAAPPAGAIQPATPRPALSRGPSMRRGEAGQILTADLAGGVGLPGRRTTRTGGYLKVSGLSAAEAVRSLAGRAATADRPSLAVAEVGLPPTVGQVTPLWCPRTGLRSRNEINRSSNSCNKPHLRVRSATAGIGPRCLNGEDEIASGHA
jgi:hypothetical protein